MKLISVVFAVCLLFLGCGTAGAPSRLVIALDALTIAADVIPSDIPGLSSQAVACIAAIPPVVTVVTDVIQGSQPLSAAQSAVNDLQGVVTSKCAQSLIPAKDASLILSIVKAAGDFLGLFRAQVSSVPTAVLLNRAYAHGFVDEPSTAGHYKASAADKKKAKQAAARAKKLAEKLAAAGKVGK